MLILKENRTLSLLAICIALLLGCSSPNPTNIYSNNINGDGNGSSSLANTLSISELKSYYLGSTHQITDDIRISARVVATDMFGELEGRMVLQDDSGGIEIYIDQEKLYESYQLYSYITINCTGLWLASRGGSNGTLVMGAYPSAYDPVDGLSSTQFETCLVEYKTADEAYEYKFCTLSDLSTSLISSCVVMQSLEFVDADSDETLFDYEQYEELSYCRRTMVCQQSGVTIDLYIPDTIVYPDVSISQIERSSGNYLVLIDRYTSQYSIQLIGMGNY